MRTEHQDAGDGQGGRDLHTPQSELRPGYRWRTADGSRSIRVVLVDDHELVLNALTAVMEQEPDLEVVGTARSIAEALEVTSETRPDLVVMDFRLPDGDGALGTRAIRAANPDMRVVMLSGRDDDTTRQLAEEAGCTTFVVKGARLDQLAAAIRSSIAGDMGLS